MPNGLFSIPAFKTVPARHPAAGLRLLTKARLQRGRLDRKLAHGADPHATPELNLRAAQLRSHGERARIANALVMAVGESRRGDPVTIRTRPHRADVRASADELLALANRLRDDLPIDVRGAAMAARLVDDRKGPLRTTSGRDLTDAIESTRQALDTRREIAADVRGRLASPRRPFGRGGARCARPRPGRGLRCGRRRPTRARSRTARSSP
jgi:hypothetical protein